MFFVWVDRVRGFFLGDNFFLFFIFGVVFFLYDRFFGILGTKWSRIRFVLWSWEGLGEGGGYWFRVGGLDC